MGLRRPKVLIVDDEDAIALSLHRLLYQRCDHFDTLVTRTAEVARAVMREIRMDVLITDVHLPGMSGVDLASWVSKESHDTQVILMSGQETKALQEKLPEDLYLHFLEKPFEPGALLRIVEEAMDCAERLSGKLSVGEAADIIQFLCLGRRTAELRITSGEAAGSVIVDEGKLVHASWGDKVGEPAICEILAVNGGVFRTRARPSGPEPTIFRDWQHVLIDAARVLDERKSDAPKRLKKRPEKRAESAPPNNAYPTTRGDSDNGHTSGVRSVTIVSSPPIAGTESAMAAARLVDKGFAALRNGNKEEARRCWEAAKELDPDNRAIDLNLRKLGNLSARG
jgi:FixJ family two-component response regulator